MLQRLESYRKLHTGDLVQLLHGLQQEKPDILQTGGGKQDGIAGAAGGRDKISWEATGCAAAP